MDLYLVTTRTGPALCKHRYLIEWQLLNRPDRYQAFTGPLSHLHAAQCLDARFPGLWPNGEVQVTALVVSVLDHHLLTFRPERFPLEERAKTDTCN
jgi:hypothetical protein